MTNFVKTGLSRRHLFRTPLGLAAGSIAAPALLSTLAGDARAEGGRAGNGHPKLDPKYYPLRHFRPDVSLRGKLAVITGASRGNGRAVGDALAMLGADVIGTSRNPATVPNVPTFPLLKLDIADPASVLAFPALLAAHPTFQRHRQVDILCNNAGRMVLGSIVPRPPTDPAFYFSQRDLGVRTLYSGHVMVTNVMVPLMPSSGYARIMFTISSISYLTGFAQPGGSYMDVYNASKAALRSYANCLAAAFRDAQLSIRVSCVHPYAMRTGLATHPNPIYTQPVGPNGLSATDPIFNAVAAGGQQLLANALPPSMVGNTYAQLLQMAEPELNVVVGSPDEPLATQGANSFVEDGLLAENKVSALPLR
jgi:NAD(P)-dependent dehydrogenase (short-subunit alcohol dehydrogenase family)